LSKNHFNSPSSETKAAGSFSKVLKIIHGEMTILIVDNSFKIIMTDKNYN
jgi:hypothetical protein